MAPIALYLPPNLLQPRAFGGKIYIGMKKEISSSKIRLPIGLVVSALCCAFLSPAGAQSLSYSRLLTAVESTGNAPVSPMAASDGRLYGVMEFSGPATNGSLAFGVIYRLNGDGSGFQVVHSFDDPFSTDPIQPGSRPVGRLAEASDGRLYGVCFQGGRTDGTPGGLPSGTLFRLNKDGSGFENVLVFEPSSGSSSTSTTGQRPVGGLLAASDGRLYGHTFQGGTSNRGTLYRITLGPGGTPPSQNVVFNFGTSVLREPVDRPIEGPDGFFYGIAGAGGTGFGGLYRVRGDGTSFEVLHSFQSSAGQPTSLVRASDGRLIGSTTGFGTGPNTLFAYDFSGNGPAGFSSLTTVSASGGTGIFVATTLGSDGRIYGNQFDTNSSFAASNGRISRINADGTDLETVASFGVSDGIFTSGPLLEIQPNVFIGATLDGGQFERGTLFKLSDSNAFGELPSSLKPTGSKRIRTTNGKIEIVGQATGGSNFTIEFRVGTKGKFKPARGTGKWSLTAKVKPGKNFVFIRARLSDGTTSRPVRLTVIRG